MDEAVADAGKLGQRQVHVAHRISGAVYVAVRVCASACDILKIPMLFCFTQVTGIGTELHNVYSTA